MAARDARVEELSAIQVGMTLANFYEDDTMWHERVVLWPAMDDDKSWWIVTPDFDVYPERFDLDGRSGPSRVRIKGTTFSYWSRFREPTYRFASALSDEEFKGYVEQAMEETRKAGAWKPELIPKTLINRKGQEVSTASFLGRALRVRLTGKFGAVHDPALQGVAPADYAGDLGSRLKPIVPAPEGYLWVAEEMLAGRSLGEELGVLPGGGVMVGSDIGLVMIGQEFIRGRLLKIEEVPAHAESLRKRYMPPEAPVVARQELAPPPQVLAVEEEDKGQASPEDARILSVDYDAQDERYKEWKLVCQETTEYSFRDWPMDGPLCTLHMLKQMQKAGGSPKAWLQTWARFKQIPEGDRIMFELRTLVEAVEYGGSYDQLNLPSLAAFECISRRIMAIVDAFGAGSANNPDWGAARIFTNYRGPEDIVMPQLKQWASKKGKEEAELHQARTKMRELRRGVPTEEAATAVAEGALAAAAAPKRKGKKGAGRGLTPPAQE